MSLLYEVYIHESKGIWGVAIQSQTVHTATVNGLTFFEEKLPAHQFASEVSRRLRMGYTKTTRPKYLKVTEGPDGKREGRFVEQHPELTVQGGMVLFTTVSKADDLQELSKKLEVLVEKSDARPEAIESWVRAIQSADQYIVAPATHPAIPLVLADWAMENKRLIVAGADGVPLKAPKHSPREWENWLAGFFTTRSDIQTALTQLGWSLCDALMRNDVQSEKNEDVNDSWFTNATSYSF